MDMPAIPEGYRLNPTPSAPVPDPRAADLPPIPDGYSLNATPAEVAAPPKHPAGHAALAEYRSQDANLARGVLDVGRTLITRPIDWARRQIDPTAEPTAGSNMAEEWDKDLATRDTGSPTSQLARTYGGVQAGAAALSPVNKVVGAGVEAIAGPGATAFMSGMSKSDNYWTKLFSRMFASSAAGGEYAAATSASSDESLINQIERGATLGAALPVAGAVLGAGGRAVGTVAAPFFRSGNEHMAGEILNKYAQDGSTSVAKAPLPGMQLNTAQATGNAGLSNLGDTLASRPGSGIAAAAEAGATANNTSIRVAMGQIGDTEANAPAAMAKAIGDASKAAIAKTDAAWEAAGLDRNKTKIPMAPLLQSVTTYIGNLTKAEQRSIPNSITAILKEFDPSEPLREVQGLQDHVSTLATQAANSGNRKGAELLGDIADRISSFTDSALNPAINEMTGAGTRAGSKPLLDTARAATQQYHQTFTQPAPVRKVLGVDKFGADQVPLSATADAFIHSGKGGPEAFEAYLGAVGDDAAGLQAARDAFAKKFMDSTQATATDRVGERLINPDKVVSFLDKYDHVVQSRLFTDEQRALMQNIQKASDMARAPAAGKAGADDAAKLMGDNYLNVLLGPSASKLIPLAGAMVGAKVGLMGGGLVGGAMGLIGGGVATAMGETKLLNVLYAAPRERVLDLLTQAVKDPAVAEALMTKAGKPVSAAAKSTITDTLSKAAEDTPTDPGRRGMFRSLINDPSLPVDKGGSGVINLPTDRGVEQMPTSPKTPVGPSVNRRGLYLVLQPKEPLEPLQAQL